MMISIGELKRLHRWLCKKDSVDHHKLKSLLRLQSLSNMSNMRKRVLSGIQTLRSRLKK